MSNPWKLRMLAALLASSLGLVACGGGGGGGEGSTTDGSGGPGTTQPQATDFTLSGVAAIGAPLAHAVVQVRDATGAVVGTPVTTADDGSYSYAVPKAAIAPFVVSVTLGDVALFTPVAVPGDATANVTPLTNLAAVALSPTGDPTKLADQIAAGTATVSQQRIDEVVGNLVTALAPLRENVGDATNPITGTFRADGSGHDRLINSLNVAVLPAGATSDIVITVKAAVADGEQAPRISFTSNEAPPSLPPEVATAALPPTDIDARIGALVARLNACFAEPVSQRVAGTGASARVVSPECNTVFKGGDAANYRNSGSTVGPNGSFSSLFNEGATGVVFRATGIEFASAGGTLVVSFQATAVNGNVTTSQLVLGDEAGTLRIWGNQYLHAGTVTPWAEDREFLNSPDANYLTTGFNVLVTNEIANGQPAFNRVEVTTPRGTHLVLRPRGGLSFLVLERTDHTLTNTSVVRLAGAFTGSATGSPRQRESALYWDPNPAGDAAQDWSDAEISGIANIGSWKMEYFLAGNTGTRPDAVQFAITFVRPSTLPELRQKSFAQLTPAFAASMAAGSGQTGALALSGGQVFQFGTAGEPAWTVSQGALPPTLAQIQGAVSATNAARWNDSSNTPVSARSTVITCSAQSASDAHCAPSGGYAQGAQLDQLQLFANDPRQEQRVKSVNLFRR